MVDTMSWYSIAAALVLPLAVGILVAWPFWGRSRDSLGSGVGAVLILAFAIGFIGLEYTHLQRFSGECLAVEQACRFQPEPFTRFCIYAFIAMTQVGTLFAISRAVEHRVENAGFSPEWQR
jgi:hypothetical protein